MPELPEVETIARGVDERLRGDRIAEVWFSSHTQPFKNSPAEQAAGLEGRTILGVRRVGKHIVCDLGDAGSPAPSAQWIVHLGMSGRLLVTTPDALVAPHTHARLSLASGREMRFVDPRRFGRLEFRELNRTKAFTGPGYEPTTITPEDFARLFRGRNKVRRILDRRAGVVQERNVFVMFPCELKQAVCSNKHSLRCVEHLQFPLLKIGQHLWRPIKTWVDAVKHKAVVRDKAIRSKPILRIHKDYS